MSEIAISLSNLGKVYKLYYKPADKVLDALGVNRWLFWRKNYYQEFWALRGLNLTVKKGERVGIIGRNGAGKSTLLKIISSIVTPTEGTVQVNDRIQALMEMGTGSHPEFTGRENIRASLAYQGLLPAQIQEKEEDIIDFAELDEFIDQPVRTYSAGMYTRLAFSTATSIEPDILIIDEVLGAGDAYFTGKCVERMKQLTVDSGVTLLFVSHDISSVERLCDRCIWIDRGKDVMNGPTLDVVNAYQQQVSIQENQRLKAKNLKVSIGGYKKLHLDQYADLLLIRFSSANGRTNGFCLQQVTLLQDAQEAASMMLGEAQDTNQSHSTWVILDRMSCWTNPVSLKNEGWGRGLTENKPGLQTQGMLVFNMYVLNPNANYSLTVRYLSPLQDSIKVELYNGNDYIHLTEIKPNNNREIAEIKLELPESVIHSGKVEEKEQVLRWPGSNEIMIDKVLMVDENGQEKVLFRVGEQLVLKMKFSARMAGKYPVTFCAVLYRTDGIRVSCHLSKEGILDLPANKEQEVDLIFGEINLGNGGYVFSVALYNYIDTELRNEPKIYDLHSRIYEFQVVGRSVVDGSIFNHPSSWRIVDG